MWETRGIPTRQHSMASKQAGYEDVHILEIILALAVKTISNYSNHVNRTDHDSVFARYEVKESA